MPTMEQAKVPRLYPGSSFLSREIGRFFIAIMVSPKLEKFPCDSRAFTIARADSLSEHYKFLLRGLRSEFNAYKTLFQRDLSFVYDNEWEQIRHQFDWDKNGIMVVINGLFEAFDEPNMKMLQENWDLLLRVISEKIQLATQFINTPNIRDEPQTLLASNQYNAFIPIAKLIRLLMRKLYKYTNPLPHLDLRIPFDGLNGLSKEMHKINHCCQIIHMAIDVPRDPASVVESMHELVMHIEEVYDFLLDHFEDLDPILDDQYAPRMLEWCERWKLSFDSAAKRYDPNSWIRLHEEHEH